MIAEPVLVLASVWIGFGIFGLYALVGMIAGGVHQKSRGTASKLKDNNTAAKPNKTSKPERNWQSDPVASSAAAGLEADLGAARLPLDRFEVTSFFGPRRGGFHQGIDLDEKRGAAVYAAWAGRVIFAGERRGYGKVVDLSHRRGATEVVTRYAHLERFAVRKGERVERGRVIGAVGNSGVTRGGEDGTHLHFEVRIAGEAVDPLPYLK